MTDRYILDGQEPRREPDLIKWGIWMEGGENMRVRWTEFEDAAVSTVFLGLNHNYGAGPPILFETMIMTIDRSADGSEHHQWEDHQWRYATWSEAEAGHQAAVSMVKMRKQLAYEQGER